MLAASFRNPSAPAEFFWQQHASFWHLHCCWPFRVAPGMAATRAGGMHGCREVLNRMKVGGSDRMLVTGLGPVGLAAAMLGRALGSPFVIGTDVSAARRALLNSFHGGCLLLIWTQLGSVPGQSFQSAGSSVCLTCRGSAPRRSCILCSQVWRSLRIPVHEASSEATGWRQDCLS